MAAKEGKMMNFYHKEHFEEKREAIPTGGGKYCKYGMNNEKEAKEKADKLASYAKSHRPQ